MKKIAVVLLDLNDKSPAAHHTLQALDAASARTQIFSAADVSKLIASNFDALILVDDLPDASAVAEAFHASSKPIGAFDQAIAMIAETLGDQEITIAVGPTSNIAAIKATGAYAEKCANDDFVSDRDNKIVSTLHDATGIQRAVAELLEMA